MTGFNSAARRYPAVTFFVGVFCAISAMSAVQAESIKVGGTGTLQSLVPPLAEAYRASRPDIQIEGLPRSLGSTGGIDALRAGVIDIAMSARPLKDGEAAAGLVAIPLGTTPLVFTTSSLDAPRALTSAQALAIYRLETKTWPDGSAIRIILRPESDADTDLLIRYIGGMDDVLRGLRNFKSIPVALTDQENLDLAERMTGSFAVTALTTLVMEKRNLRVFAFDGAMPTLDNLANRTYRMSKQLFFVIKSDATQPVRDAVAFVQSSAGHAVLLKNDILPASR